MADDEERGDESCHMVLLAARQRDQLKSIYFVATTLSDVPDHRSFCIDWSGDPSYKKILFAVSLKIFQPKCI